MRTPVTEALDARRRLHEAKLADVQAHKKAQQQAEKEAADARRNR